MNIINFEDISSLAYKEGMLSVWIEFENNGLFTHLTYGFDGEKYYTLGEGVWNPMYVKTYEDFINRIEENSVFYEGSCLLKIK